MTVHGKKPVHPKVKAAAEKGIPVSTGLAGIIAWIGGIDWKLALIAAGSAALTAFFGYLKKT